MRSQCSWYDFIAYIKSRHKFNRVFREVSFLSKATHLVGSGPGDELVANFRFVLGLSPLVVLLSLVRVILQDAREDWPLFSLRFD